AGLLLDFIPPATGTAGRWGLGMVIVGHLAGKVGTDALRSLRIRLVLVAGCSFMATSFYALSGVALGDTSMDAVRMPEVIALGVMVDVIAALLVLPWALRLIRLLRPVRVLS
ncbi:MAG TPA: rod shape-determining protein MreD, partial [Marmoricola sp.]|nr:rod shape-determining protein MreD [Marmoricola sp.]